jgi:peptide deformylase
LIDDMIETMYAAPGVGLAATQVGVPLRIFVVESRTGRPSPEPSTVTRTWERKGR